MFDSIVRRIVRVEEDIRRLKLRVDGHTETKTFVVSGGITVGLYIPPFFVGVSPDPDSGLIESKVIYAVRGVLRTGVCTVNWLVNGEVVQAGHGITVDTYQGNLPLATALEVNDGDVVQPVIADATNAADLAAAVVMTTRWR